MISWLIYTVLSYICLIPLQLWIPSIGISLLSGLFLGLLNEIRRELMISNKSECLCDCDKEDKPDELIKG